MATYTFNFENTNDDQSFEYVDERDERDNPHEVGPVNHGDTSPPCTCWVGSDGHGSIVLKGTTGPQLRVDILYDNYSFRY